mmetsp:Transcript_27463/g.53671  ORF Transcript_27463/g.53671 Transcript_27463/m.53671 type:complete len:154 (+) Transcript_27463:77-538(+)
MRHLRLNVTCSKPGYLHLLTLGLCLSPLPAGSVEQPGDDVVTLLQSVIAVDHVPLIQELAGLINTTVPGNSTQEATGLHYNATKRRLDFTKKFKALARQFCPYLSGPNRDIVIQALRELVEELENKEGMKVNISNDDDLAFDCPSDKLKGQAS